MRLRPVTLLLSLALAGCTLALPGGKAEGPAPLATDAIEVSKLDAPKAAAPEPQKPQKAAEAAPAKPEPAPPEDVRNPEEAPDPEPETPPEAAPPPAPLSPEAQACQRKGGRYVKAGSGSLRACVQTTRDAGKACKRETDCEGACLARSGTCSPVTPLFGCNDILQADGRRVTLCLD